MQTAFTAYFSSSVAEFLRMQPQEVLGRMASRGQFSLDIEQRNAWEQEIEILHSALAGLDGHLFLEFDIPRIGSRIDVVLVSKTVIFPIEFKVGESVFRRCDVNQVWDYGLDLKNFHKGSHAAPIIPILAATNSRITDTILTTPHPDGVYPPVRTNGAGLRHVIELGYHAHTTDLIEPESWDRASYQPTPSIIEAAQALYSRHSVDAIASHDAGKYNLKVTSTRVEELIDEAARLRRKTIIFVTGVPGAGKTLVGLNVATKKRDPNKSTHAVFLSGNKPLVDVLCEALTRDELERTPKGVQRPRKGVVKQKIKAFIQLVHHFRDAGLRNPSAPSDRVVIFDEAQRAWDQAMTTDFMVRKKRYTGFNQSEPDFLISCMNRHQDWAVIVCLVGGGQEINRGEAGISAWLDAVREGFPDWHVYLSPDLTDNEYAAGHALELLRGAENIKRDSKLHLAVSIRSFRAEKVSNFVKAVLDCEKQRARKIFEAMHTRYPVVVTRNLAGAKEWIRQNARGTERFGIIASSSAQRLKPHAIDVRVAINPVHWFLNDFEDTRSSLYLEDAATEFQVQGLELDWACVTWDADFRFAGNGWNCHSFRGSKWTKVHKAAAQKYLLNAYRVLLTRARQGMVIFVPAGDAEDLTRDPAFYNSTFRYLKDIGLPEI